MNNDPPFDPFRQQETPEPVPPPPLSVVPTPQPQPIVPGAHHRHFSPWWIVFGIVVLALIGYGIYLFTQPAAPARTASTTPATTNTTTTSSASVPLQPGETVATNGSLTIPTLGITLVNLPSSLGDLRQIEDGFSAGETDINLSTTSLTALDTNCADNSADDGGIGSLIATKGTYNASSDGLGQGGIYLGQFSSFWLEFTPAESACSNNNQAVSLQATQAKALQSYIQVSGNVQG